MQRSLFLVALMVLAAVPAATAHDPPGPVLTCQGVKIGDTKYHDYLPPNVGYIVIGGDGNVNDCPKDNEVQVGLHLCLEQTQNIPVVCDPVGTGVTQPTADYDGELDHATGGAFLFVTTGDGATSGVTACYGWPSVGHHTMTIYAMDVAGFGPQFTVTADWSRPGLEENPDCGDNYVEPCDPNPPPPSTLEFPLNVVVDTVTGLLYVVFGPGGEGCNDRDFSYRCGVTKPGPTRCTVPFAPGADGTLVVFIEPTPDDGRVPTAGHVWTSG